MRSRWISISAAALAAFGLAILALNELRAPARPNVIILTMESARAEVMSPAVMPNVWRIARQGIRYTQHRAVSGWTAPNVISLLTGISPFAHGVQSRDQHVPADWDVPLEDLAKDGWRVVGLQPFMQIPGFQELGLTFEPGANLLGWLARRARAGQSFVLWYHYVDTHLPYAPPPPFRPDVAKLLPPRDAAARARIEKIETLPAIPAGSVAFDPATDRKAIRALYLGDFRAFDVWFAEFWNFLERSGLRDNTMVILTTDHGEELLERGNVGHASTNHAGQLHEEIVHLPLVVWLPKSYPDAGWPRVVPAMTDHLDIMPTIFAVLGVTPARKLAGTNLLDAPADRAWRATTSGAGFGEPHPYRIPRFVYAEIEWPWKLHLVQVNGKDAGLALYDLATDPAETRDVAAAHPDMVAHLSADLRPSILAMHHPSPPSAEQLAANAATPRWVFPPASGAYRYDDLNGRFRLQWTGRDDRTYRIQYRAGSGLLSLAGEFDVAGTARDFGTISRDYWDTWLVPYGSFRLRVGVPGRDDHWSRWIELKALK
jgi:choline-sulfatase